MPRRRRHAGRVVCLLAAAVTGMAAPARGQTTPAPDASALARQTQNPVADLVSLPLQFNFNTGGDLGEQAMFNLNVQPVLPIRLTSRVKLIARTILPINSVPGPDGMRFSGVGDIQEQLFFTPAASAALVWGVGPVFSFPTATAAPLATGTWAGGVGGVVLLNAGPFVLGSLVTQFWPMSDTGDAVATDLLVVQPFVNYNLRDGWALSFAPIISANWNAPADSQWTVPLGLGISKTTVFEGQPMSLSFQYYYNVERPAGSAGQQVRFTLSFLFPQGT